LTVIAKRIFLTLKEKCHEVDKMKLLYIDVPFEGLQGGDKNRSKAIWKSLSEEFVADLLLIKGPQYRTQKVEEHHSYNKLHTLGCIKPLPHESASIYRFHPRQLEKFRAILTQEQYDIVVFRFLSPYRLAQELVETLPLCKVVIDVDMLFSRIAELSWQQNHDLRNRYSLIEMLKLKRFEKRAFSHDFGFYFTNPIERDLAVAEYDLDIENARIYPNLMPMEEPKSYPKPKQPYVLFFGTLNSMANQDAVCFLADEIYPQISAELRKAGVQMHIVGANASDYLHRYQDDCFKIIGRVDDMQEIIAGAEFVVLPIRIASGTRTRILEAAQMKKAVLTTSVGMEGFPFGSTEIMIRENAEDLGAAILELLEDKELRTTLGENLYEAARTGYSAKTLSGHFIKSLKEPAEGVKPKKLKLAIVSNRFYPEVGGAETNIYYQARKLAEANEVTVFCPKRIQMPALERVAGFRLRRLYDLYNRKGEYPNLKTKTLCPTLLWYLLIGKYDVIQCFPAINYNNIIAFVASQIMNIPYIVCFFDFVDYAAYLQKQGKIDPDLLEKTPLKWYQKIILARMDYAFAIANKEIEFLKKYNLNVEYSPVPVLSSEFEIEVGKPPLMRTWNHNPFVFLCLGRVSYIKGQDIALGAFAKVASQMQGAQLVFVGRSDYEPDFLEKMKEIMNTAGVSERVHFTDQVERKEVIAWLKHADIHLIPVRFMNSGAVVIESWISDTPVLQSDVVDPNLVIEAENGYNFVSEDLQSCADKMLLAYNNRENLPALAAKGKELVKRKYTYDYLINLYQETYQKLLGI